MIKKQGLGWRGLLPGDVLYIHTGWSDHWQDPDIKKVYYTKGPGLSHDAAQYMKKAVVLVALDNPFTDPVFDGQLMVSMARRKEHHQGSRSPYTTKIWRFRHSPNSKC